MKRTLVGVALIFAMLSMIQLPRFITSSFADNIYESNNGGGHIYALGGKNTRNFWRYNLDTNSWDTLANTPGNVHAGGDLAMVGDYIYGMGGGSTNAFWRYDPATDTWSDSAAADVPLPPGKEVGTGGALTYDDNYVYAIVGGNDSSTDNDLWRYDPSSDTWTLLTYTPVAQSGGSDITYGDGYIYFFGGNNGNDDPSTWGPDNPGYEFYRYNIAADSWERLADVPGPEPQKEGAAIVFHAGSVLGGSTASGSVYGWVGGDKKLFYRYDIATNTWITDPPEDSPYKVENGSDLCSDGTNAIYGFPATDTQYFQVYDTDGDVWTQLAQTPAQVHDGGALLCAFGGGSSADLSLTKEASSGEAALGDTIVFTLTVTNDGPSPSSGSTVSDTLPSGFTYVDDDGNGSYDPNTGVWTVGSLAVGGSVSLHITSTVTTGDHVNYAQIATANESDPDSTPGNGAPPTPAEDDEGAVTVNVPVIGLAKENSQTVNNGDGTYTITFTLTAENLGDVALSNISITDDIVGQFVGMNPTGFTATDGSFTANPSWDGQAGTNILAAGQSLAVGESKTVQISFTVTPGSATSADNTANATGESPSGATVSDQSTDGADPDPNGDGNPDENAPTPVNFDGQSALGDFVWLDINGNGVQDAGEPGMAGVTVHLLDGAGTQLASAQTDVNGYYQFDQLSAGDYVVEFVLPSGYAFSPRDNASDDAIDSDVDTSTGRTDIVTLAEGDSNMTVDAGMIYGRAGENFCYVAADADDELASVNADGTVFQDIGSLNVSYIEAIALNLNWSVLYGADADELGTIDVNTGDFSSIGYFGGGDGADGWVDFDDVDSLSFDPVTGVFYGVTRRNDGSPNDALFQINPATGAHVPDAFGSGVDYVIVDSASAVGLYDIDDIAVDPAGQMYGIANSSGGGDHLVKIDKFTGAVTDVGRLTYNGAGLDDMEGLTAFGTDALYGVTGASGNESNSMWRIDKTTGEATKITTFPEFSDYEAIACKYMPPPSLSGRVWHDVYHDENHKIDGIQDDGEPSFANVTVELYDANDVLVATTSTDSHGNYQFDNLDPGDYHVQIADSNFQGGGALDETDDAVDWHASPQDAGNDDTVDSDGDESSYDVWVTLAAGEDKQHVDFGFFKSCVNLVKTGPSTVNAGDTFNFHFQVNNCGDVVLHGGVSVYDALLNPDGDHEIWNEVVYPGETKEFDESYTISESECPSLTNDATAEGHPQHPDGSYLDNVTDQDSWTVTCPTEDWGDAPKAAQSGFASSYPTTQADDGARHTVTGPFMGAAVDAENDGQPTAQADGDDLNGPTPDDEDGVTFTSYRIPGQSATLDVDMNASPSDCLLNAWIDFNQDGDWNDAGEQIFTNQSLIAGQVNQLTYAIPADAQGGKTFARFRCSTQADLPPTGPAPDGEVEDYAVTIAYPPAACTSYLDPFDNTPSYTLYVNSDSGPSYQEDTHTGLSSVLGHARQLKLGPVSGYSGVTVKAGDHGSGQTYLTESADANTQAPLRAIYDAAGAGLNADFSNVHSLVLEYNSSDIGEQNPPPDSADVTITISDGANSASLTQSLLSVAPSSTNTPFDFVFPLNDFSGIGSVNLQNVKSIQVEFEGVNAGDWALDNIACEPKLSLGDFVWQDDDADGVQDANETGIEGVSVDLYAGTCDTLTSAAVPMQSTTTAADGSYGFTDLAAGDYCVVLSRDNFAPGGPLVGLIASPANASGDPATDSNGSASHKADVSLSADDDTIDFGLYPAPPIEYGQCYVISDSGDYLGRIDYATGRVNVLGKVDPPDGENLAIRPADYVLFNVAGENSATPLITIDDQTAATTTIHSDLGLDDVDALTFDPVTQTMYAVKVDPNPGVLYIVDPSTGATTHVVDLQTPSPDPLSGKVDPHIDGIAVHPTTGVMYGIYSAWAAKSYLVTIDTATGALTLVGGVGGEAGYTGVDDIEDISFRPDGTLFGALGDQGALGSDSSGSFEGLVTIDIQTAQATAVGQYGDPLQGMNEWDIEALSCAIPPTAASLGDFVWHDLNANGVQDGGEPGIDGVTVDLFKSDGTFVATTQTANGGQYLFDNLVPGDYYVQFTLPSGYVFSPKDQGGDDAKDSDADAATGKTDVTTLSSGENDLTWDAGMYQKASIGDFVWWDLNEDGIQDAGEPGLAGVTVTLKDSNGATVATATTDANGAYSFLNLDPGDYYLIFTLPGADWSFSPKDQGGDDAKDSDADTATGQTATTTLTSGENDLTWDAGMTIPSSYTITKENTTVETDVAPGDPISFTITIENTGSTILTVIPLRDTYDTNYLAFTGADIAPDDSNDDGQIDWSDLTVSFGQDLEPGQSFTVIVNFTAKTATDPEPNSETINKATAHDVQADPDGTNGPVSATTLPDQSDEAPARILDPVGEDLSDFSALIAGNAVRLRWQTATERDILGFNILRKAAGEAHFTRVNSAIIFARHAGADVGAAYSFVDRGTVTGHCIYALEVIHLDGSVERYYQVISVLASDF